MSDDLIRKVARAIFDAENEWRTMQGELGGPIMPARMFRVGIVQWLLLARAALAVMNRQDAKTDDKTFREKLIAAMKGHRMSEVTSELAIALGHVLHEANQDVREQLIEEACARVARIAARPPITGETP